MQIKIAPQQHGVGWQLGTYLRSTGLSLKVLRSLKWLENGITVNGCKAKTNQVLHSGDTIVLNYPTEHVYSALPQEIPINIVYESMHALAINKPAGMAMHPGPSHHGGTLANAYCGLMQERALQAAAQGGFSATFRPIGRLDAQSSGLVLCAMHAGAAKGLAKTAKKLYLALVVGRPQLHCGVVNAPLAPVPGSAVLQQVCAGGKPSTTQYRLLAACETASILLLQLKTGRTHQIRTHMAYIGHPLLGDSLYGGQNLGMQRAALHCCQLCFTDFGGENIRLSLPLPKDMLACIAALGMQVPAIVGSELWGNNKIAHIF